MADMPKTIAELDDMREREAHQPHGPDSYSLFDVLEFYWRDKGHHPDDAYARAAGHIAAFVRAIREADERAGLVTVPKEPTVAMQVAANSLDTREWVGQNYRAMLAASPFAMVATLIAKEEGNGA